MRLKALQDLFGESTGEPASEMRTRVDVLRSAKLLTTGPRGPGAPHMTARDLATLLLATLAPGAALKCAETVEAVGAAELFGVDRIPHDGSRPTGWSRNVRAWRDDDAALLPAAMIGARTALDAVEAAIAAYVADDPDPGIEGIEVEAVATGPRVRLHLRGSADDWRLEYAAPLTTGRRIARRGSLDGACVADLARDVMEVWR
jgi:hypothetical protein